MYRDKATGRTTTREEYAEARAKERRRPEPSKEEQHIEWKAGLAQKRAAEEAGRRMQAEVRLVAQLLWGLWGHSHSHALLRCVAGRAACMHGPACCSVQCAGMHQ